MAPRIDERKFKRINRRELLKLAPVLALGAFAVPKWRESLLKSGVGFSDWASARLFREGHLAREFSDSDVVPFNKFPINGYDVEDPGVDFDAWTLTVSGAVQKPGDYTLAQIQALPKMRHNTRHVCVEGWDVIGRFGGTKLSNFLQMVGADTTAKFISVECADDYYESLDMATALHPQTQMSFKFANDTLPRAYGFPMKIRVPTKLGFKNPKYVLSMEVTNEYKGGYWEDQGYNSFSGS